MIFSTVQDYSDWVSKNIPQKDQYVDGVVLEVHPEKTERSAIWRCNKAKEFGYPVFCFLFGRNWKLMREKLVGVPYDRDFDFRTKEDVINLAQKLEPLVDYVVLVEPDTIDPSSIIVDYSYLDSAELTPNQKELLRGCYAMTYILRRIAATKRIQRRLFFVQDGPMYLYGSRATEKALTFDREILTVTDVLRNEYQLVESAQSGLSIDIIKQEKPEWMEDIEILHSVAVDYANGNMSSLSNLKHFVLDSHTMTFTGYPLPLNSVLYHIFFTAAWEKGTFMVKDVIYKT